MNSNGEEESVPSPEKCLSHSTLQCGVFFVLFFFLSHELMICVQTSPKCLGIPWEEAWLCPSVCGTSELDACVDFFLLLLELHDQ